MQYAHFTEPLVSQDKIFYMDIWIFNSAKMQPFKKMIYSTLMESDVAV